MSIYLASRVQNLSVSFAVGTLCDGRPENETTRSKEDLFKRSLASLVLGLGFSPGNLTSERYRVLSTMPAL